MTFRVGDKVSAKNVDTLLLSVGWSDWGCLDSVNQHSHFYSDCHYQAIVENISGGFYKLFRIKLPREVKVSYFKGTVQIKQDGTPDWSTYKE